MKLILCIKDSLSPEDRIGLGRLYLGNSDPTEYPTRFPNIVVLSDTPPTVDKEEVSDLFICMPDIPSTGVSLDTIYYAGLLTAWWSESNDIRRELLTDLVRGLWYDWCYAGICLLEFAASELIEVRQHRTIVDEGSCVVYQFCSYNQY